MTYLALLRLGVIGSFIFSAAGLIFLLFRNFAWGKQTDFSQARGRGMAGVAYAFGKGMMPWEKESAGKHLPTLIGGVLYHCAIFLSILYLFWTMMFPRILLPLLPVRTVLSLGIIAGFSLLVKRIITPLLRQISCADDFISNLLCDIFLVLTLAHTFVPFLEPILFTTAILLFIYIPLGKIRHCFFFFYTRVLFGVFFGKRGVFPHPR